MSEEGDCPICHLKALMPIQVQCCRQSFCFLCLKGCCLLSNFKCPMCRGVIDPVIINRATQEINPLAIIDPEPVSNTSDSEVHFWLYEGSNGWWRYEPRVEQYMESCYCSDSEVVEVSICGYVYVVNFGSMIQYRKDLGIRKKRAMK
ncbi:unnamed protein product [Auanema sp. JU1783]|nr:unnamed protein product [Auanema sp. JU1783]